MSTNKNTQKPFTFRFINAKPKSLLELTNTTENEFKSIEILTVFLKDEETCEGEPSQVHIRFEAIKLMQPRATVVLAHRTWINGKPADAERDQVERLRVNPGEVSPYILDLLWEDGEGKTRFQRIPVGH
jgi:hypothetical protein